MDYIDFRSGLRSSKIEILLPGWTRGERVAFFAPHDDDVALGAGYLVVATVKNGGIPLIFVFCSGNAGYSTVREKETIVSTRKREAVAAYQELGVEKNDIIFFEVPDFALMSAVDRQGLPGQSLFDRILISLRTMKISRVVFPSGHFEHWDHTAAFYHGIYTAPQAGDPILVDLGPPHPIRSYLVYSVWSDFEPSAGHSRQDRIRADLGILVSPKAEKTVRDALACFVSQGKIMRSTVAMLREKRKTRGGYLELYKKARIREPIDFKPYFERLKDFRKI